MEQAIRDFNKQFAWKAAVVNGERLFFRGSTSKRGLEVEPPCFRKFVVGGMGGSHLAAGILAGWKPELDMVIHRDYGLPAFSDAKGLPAPSTVRQAGRLYIASSYSGNTEETINFAQAALKKGYAVAAMSIGGKLLEFARKHQLPHIVIPDTKIQPRSALGFAIRALAALIGDSASQKELAKLAFTLKPGALEGKGEKLAQTLRGKVPVVYASTRNQAIAYNWKIKMNETGKIPAFYNVFPELNHNEMTGFDVSKRTTLLSKPFHFIFLTDSEDHPKIQKRMQVTKKLYRDRGLAVTEVPLENTPPLAGDRRSTPLIRGDTTPVSGDGNTPFTKGDRGDSRLQRIFTSLLIADWTALHLSRLYGTEAELVPMVEQFKKMIS